MKGESLGLNTQIVSTLRQYGAIPLEFLAKVLSRRLPDIIDDLQVLEKQGIVEQKEGTIKLLEKGR